MTEIKRTVWLNHFGYFEWTTAEEARNPQRRFIMVKTQNTTDPEIGEYLEKKDVQVLIAKGFTVNIGGAS